ncbi:FAD-binding and (Fe-S)-binding domain-containing protein [Blastopirellula marina]|uniref:D-lactate dehydrogenase (cytochrome) n=1 Tax=Blastopirellula marina DSM 3645 TaxID=314230 RepID=A3ZT76_9BACT|nr:FAD-binding and (Fe-S)-binding domain-containing protein [Blastopirellula marina]EAQ80127.1 putative oxidoreductase [Blastopirellula marina DSM 3645]
MKKLFQPDPLRILPVGHQPTADRAPDELAAGSPAWLRDDLIEMLDADQVLSRPIDLIKYASDASPYRLFPKVIVLPRHVEEVRQIFAYAKRKQLPVTIRASGSSLSGQAQGDGILIEARRHWAGWTIEEEGRRLRVRPGTVLFRANLALAPHGYRLGPDPASGSVCTIGGVVANNSSGMCCGTAQNSYQTIESLTFLLPTGHLIDTANPNAAEDFASAAPELNAGLLEIKREIEADAPLVERIRRKFSIKNTTGYHMEAFLDADTPLEIFRRLLIGSEGTLAFLSEAVFRTVPDDKQRLTAFLIFPDMYAAAAAVAPFVEAGAAAVELTDRASLRSVEGKPGVPDRWRELGETATGLLIEFRESTAELRDAALSAANKVLASLNLVEPAEFTTDRRLAAQFWSVRNGLLPSVGGSRPAGTSLILEDVCFPKDRLADGAIDLQQLLARHDYEGFVFGHASAGNLHFLITPSLNTQADIDRYDAFMADVVALVVDKYDGSLKAEHGTGRNVAPFVVREWGPKLTGLMWKLKRLTDPDGILSPGVLLSEDVASHLQNLHTTPIVEDEVDRCVECGYCEPVCPSRNLSTTPRQRIILRREMMRQPADSPVTLALLRDYEYEAIETCAGDGVCAIACPVNINTGNLMKEFRRQEHSATQEYVAKKAAQNWSTVESITRTALRANQLSASTLGEWPAKTITGASRAIVSHDLAPAWLPNLPAAADTKLPQTDPANATAVYFMACVNRIFGDSPDAKPAPSLAQAMVAVSARAGMPVYIPSDIWGNCCATVWHSKGYDQGNAFMANKIVESLWRWSDAGRLPIVCDASSCTLGIASEILEYLTPENRERHAQLSLLDSIDWAHDFLLPRLQIARPVGSVAVHPTCATQHLGLGEKLRALCAALALETVVPIHATCCGFAGDRGLLHPELTKAATAEQAAELDHREFDGYVSSNRTCEIGMNQATGADYRSVLFLLEELTRPEAASSS